MYESYESTRFTYDHRRAAVWREIVGWLEARFGVPESLLELGAGYCDASNASRAPVRLAVDIRAEFVRHAAPGVQTHVGPCTDLQGVEPASVGQVLASNLFEHLTRAELTQTIAAIRRSLVPEGLLVVIQPNFALVPRSYFDDHTHLAEGIFTDMSMSDFLSSQGMTIIHRQARFLPFTLRQRMPAHPWLVHAYLRSPWKPLAGQMLVVARRDS
ncbi:MAG: methyltransferase type 11 [Gemmatimonas sp.]|nr:methyltransferase type 11 [Gemmatimonas sp.]